jgi:ribosomal-protein-alanine N-acetyltransferase
MKLKFNDKELEFIRANESHAEKFYDYILTLEGDNENFIVNRYVNINLGNIRNIKWEENPMFLALYNEEVLGSVQLVIGKYFGPNRQAHVGEISYSISREFRGSGLIYLLIYFAIKSTKVTILTAWVDTRNVKSQKLLERIGFKRLGVIPNFMFSPKESLYADMILYFGDLDIVIDKTREGAIRHGLIEKESLD